MRMERFDLIVVGAGPAGLSAAIVAAQMGMRVVVFDENARPGGQLFKQIHKFFGSNKQGARVRGFVIGRNLLYKAAEAGVRYILNATVIGLYQDKEVVVRVEDEVRHYKGDAVIIATGASERMVSFEGWTLPGVMGAGAAQTMMNLYGVRPGSKVLMLGSGNVGLVIAYQLVQAGCRVVAMVDAASRIGGYGVHASKLSRMGIPFYLSHTVLKAEGQNCVEGATIVGLDERFHPIPGTEVHFDVDLICIAVGLSPMTQLLHMAGCEMEDNPGRGGYVPVCGKYGDTSILGIFAAGDVSGIEEASSAMMEGQITGIHAAEYLGYINSSAAEERINELKISLNEMRQGMFSPACKGMKITRTQEGLPVSDCLLTHGYLSDAEVEQYPGFTNQRKIHPVIECTQNIPCNPCQEVCTKGCIKIGKSITSLPAVNPEAECVNCGLCVASCPGQAIFLVQADEEHQKALITIPYEFLPLPAIGDRGKALGRDGRPVCEAIVQNIRKSEAYDHTVLLTMEVPLAFMMKARFFRKEESRNGNTL